MIKDEAKAEAEAIKNILGILNRHNEKKQRYLTFLEESKETCYRRTQLVGEINDLRLSLEDRDKLIALTLNFLSIINVIDSRYSQPRFEVENLIQALNNRNVSSDAPQPLQARQVEQAEQPNCIVA